MGTEDAPIDPSALLSTIDMRVGTVIHVESLETTDENLYLLEVDLGSEVREAAARLTDNYEQDDLVGQQVAVVLDIARVDVADFESDCLVTGVSDGEGGVVYLTPEREVPNGQRVR